MALQLYTNIICYVNGATLTEETSVKIDRTARAQEVNTVAKGFAGFSPGAPIVHITVDSAVPSRDFELNPGQFFIPVSALQPVELTCFAAGRTLTSIGFIIEDNFQHAVNQEAKLSFSFVGAPADWK